MKKEKFYPFSKSLVKSLKKLGVYRKAKIAYDSCGDEDKETKNKVNSLDACFIFSSTKEGNGYWYTIHLRIQS